MNILLYELENKLKLSVYEFEKLHQKSLEEVVLNENAEFMHTMLVKTPLENCKESTYDQTFCAPDLKGLHNYERLLKQSDGRNN